MRYPITTHRPVLQHLDADAVRAAGVGAPARAAIGVAPCDQAVDEVVEHRGEVVVGEAQGAEVVGVVREAEVVLQNARPHRRPSSAEVRSAATACSGTTRTLSSSARSRRRRVLGRDVVGMRSSGGRPRRGSSMFGPRAASTLPGGARRASSLRRGRRGTTGSCSAAWRRWRLARNGRRRDRWVRRGRAGRSPWASLRRAQASAASAAS